MKEELGKHFATESWSDMADAAQACEVPEEPNYDEPTKPELPLHLLKNETLDRVEKDSVEDPEYKSKSQRYRMLINLYSSDHNT